MSSGSLCSHFLGSVAGQCGSMVACIGQWSVALCSGNHPPPPRRIAILCPAPHPSSSKERTQGQRHTSWQGRQGKIQGTVQAPSASSVLVKPGPGLRPCQHGAAGLGAGQDPVVEPPEQRVRQWEVAENPSQPQRLHSTFPVAAAAPGPRLLPAGTEPPREPVACTPPALPTHAGCGHSPPSSK